MACGVAPAWMNTETPEFVREIQHHMTTLDDVAALGAKEQGLAIVSTLRSDGTIQSSLVNAGVLPDPLRGDRVLGFVTYGRVKLANLRERNQIAATFRSGWRWATVEGRALLIGPDDPLAEIGGERLRLLLREVFIAAGGSHDNWSEYDRVMAQERRAVVLIAPSRIYGN
jgi:PPOX class probable F420-dependent enzyme